MQFCCGQVCSLSWVWFKASQGRQAAEESERARQKLDFFKNSILESTSNLLL